MLHPQWLLWGIAGQIFRELAGGILPVASFMCVTTWFNGCCFVWYNYVEVLIAGVAGQGKKTRIVISGHSMVFWAAHCAKRSSFRSQLGLGDCAFVEWLGRRGMRWHALLLLLFHERKGPPPQNW